MIKMDHQAKVQRIFALVPDPKDRAVLRLMLDGERSTSAFAHALGISHLAKREREEGVKRCKDRLIKHIRRSEGKSGTR